MQKGQQARKDQLQSGGASGEGEGGHSIVKKKPSTKAERRALQVL